MVNQMDLSEHWKTIVDTLQDGVLVVDPGGKILAVNPSAERLTGYKAVELVGKSCRILDCTGCDIFAKGRAERWCGLYARGVARIGFAPVPFTATARPQFKIFPGPYPID